MGVVYKARQISLPRPVAIKMILSGQLADESDIRRFQIEAEAAASLQHPNIVAIYEVGQEDGQHYFSMEYVAGETLSQIVRKGPLPPKQAARYVRQIADAIHYAHGRGVTHRDIKPSNVMIDDKDQARVTDFGLAKRVACDQNLTESNQVLGTAPYMAPEQIDGLRDRVGPASDVYSIGALFYELLTRRPPFSGRTVVDTLLQVREHDPKPPRQINPQTPRDLELICLKCLEKEPGKRYLTAQELADDLERYLNGDRDLAGLPEADSAEFNPATPDPVIATMADQEDVVAGERDMGGTMRSGLYPAVLQPGTRVAELYGCGMVEERHRHRYEVNNAYRAALEQAGLVFSGLSPDGHLVEFAELPRDTHPFFVGTQAHPEFLSRPTRPHPRSAA